MSEVTRMLASFPASSPEAIERLLPQIYDELRALAAQKLAREAPGQTLQATALVHEAWLRLGGDQQPGWENRAHFFGAAAEAMRRILIDRARRRQAERHGGGWERVHLDDLDEPASAAEPTLLGVHEALAALAADSPRAAELVKLRFFAGLGAEEAAVILGITDRTARRDWRFARAWLRHHLGGGEL